MSSPIAETESSEPSGAERPKSGGSMVGPLILLILLGLGAFWGYRHWQASRLYESTDDAQVEGEVVQVSAEVPARVKRVLVEDNQVVRKGQVLVELEDTDYQVKLEQAQKALQSLDRRQQAASAQLQLTRQAGEASIVQGQSGIQVAQAGVGSAQIGVRSAQERLAQARAATAAARANLARSRTEVDVARAEVQRLDADAQSYRTLYAQEEVSRQQMEAVVTAARQSRSRLEAAQRGVQVAQAQLSQAEAGVGQGLAGVSQSQQQVSESRARVEEAQGRLMAAQVAPEQVAVAVAQLKVSQSDLEQARSSLKLARQDLERCRIVAPVDGVVSKRAALEGAFVQKGSPVLALVGTRELWVVANFKETQMTHIRPGLAVEVAVDSFPGRVFPGRVESIQAGTGARFSLLPPENAAGSFVKVVQRLPVKIVFDNPPPAETPVRAGMSVEAKVRLP